MWPIPGPPMPFCALDLEARALQPDIEIFSVTGTDLGHSCVRMWHLGYGRRQLAEPTPTYRFGRARAHDRRMAMSQNNPPSGGNSGGGMSPQKATIIVGILALIGTLTVGILNFSTNFLKDDDKSNTASSSSSAATASPSTKGDKPAAPTTSSPTPTESEGVFPTEASPSESEPITSFDGVSNDGWIKTYVGEQKLRWNNLDSTSRDSGDNNMDVIAVGTPGGAYLRNNDQLSWIAKVPHDIKNMGGGVCERAAQSLGPSPGPDGERLVVKAGDWVCVATNAGRSALLKIRVVTSAGEKSDVIADATVWSGPEAH
jgi:hypothetical protein